MSQRILVTGAAGFIGAALCERLLNDGLQVLGIDNLNDYYDVGLKRARLKRLAQFKTYRNEVLDVADAAKFNAVYRDFRPDRVVHLAAQAGVRYSIDNPHVYVDANIKGFLNVLEAVRHFGPRTWSSPRRRVFTAPTPRCRTRFTNRPNTRSRFTPRRKKPTR